MDDYLSQTELLNRIHSERQKLEAALAQLTNAQMTQPGANGEWSVKDILSHLTFWEQKMLHRIQTSIVPQPAPGETWEQMIDRMNDENYRATRDKSLDDVRADFQNSYAQVLAFIETLSEDDLNDPEKYAFWRGKPIWQYIRGDTYEHYQEHGDAIRAWHEKTKFQVPDSKSQI